MVLAMKKRSKQSARIGVLFPFLIIVTGSTALAQQSWYIPGYPVDSELRSDSPLMNNGRHLGKHSFRCWDYRLDSSNKIPARSCGVGGGVVVRVSSGTFRPTIKVISPSGSLVGRDSNEVEFCPGIAGNYQVQVSSRHERATGAYSVEVIYMPSCQL